MSRSITITRYLKVNFGHWTIIKITPKTKKKQHETPILSRQGRFCTSAGVASSDTPILISSPRFWTGNAPAEGLPRCFLIGIVLALSGFPSVRACVRVFFFPKISLMFYMFRDKRPRLPRSGGPRPGSSSARSMWAGWVVVVCHNRGQCMVQLSLALCLRGETDTGRKIQSRSQRRPENSNSRGASASHAHRASRLLPYAFLSNRAIVRWLYN